MCLPGSSPRTLSRARSSSAAVDVSPPGTVRRRTRAVCVSTVGVVSRDRSGPPPVVSPRSFYGRRDGVPFSTQGTNHTGPLAQKISLGPSHDLGYLMNPWEPVGELDHHRNLARWLVVLTVRV
ncbi:hypothetical protein Q1695_014931 [Nippostrongylus brasiliensis]|nr:hypothetical protein Q1695_014931 [Nippostrongylus brasiliensis]